MGERDEKRDAEVIRAEWDQRARDWEREKHPSPSAELLALAEAQFDAEVSSREALTTRLTALIAFSGALLTLTFALGQDLRTSSLGGLWKVLAAVTFSAAIAALFASLLRALSGVRPWVRPVTTAALLKFYAAEAADDEELHIDRFCQCCAGLEVLAGANEQSARGLRCALILLGVAGGASAATGLILFFS